MTKRKTLAQKLADLAQDELFKAIKKAIRTPKKPQAETRFKDNKVF